MKTAVVIFSRNAAGDTAFWQNVLESFAVQDLSCDLRLLVDSESEDSTVEIARKFRWEIRSVKAATFNHGLTRNTIAMELFEQGFDVAVFACFLESFFGKVACDDIVCLAVFQKIQRNCLKLS